MVFFLWNIIPDTKTLILYKYIYIIYTYANVYYHIKKLKEFMNEINYPILCEFLRHISIQHH